MGSVNFCFGNFKDVKFKSIVFQGNLTLSDISLRAIVKCPHHKVYSLVEGVMSIELKEETLEFGAYNMIFKREFEREIFLEEALANYIDSLEKLLPKSLITVCITSDQICMALENGADVDCKVTLKGTTGQIVNGVE